MRSTLLTRLTDKLVLSPTVHTIAVESKKRRQLSFMGGSLEIWTHCVRCTRGDEADVFLLKIPGTGGRAECATDHPVDLWPGVRGEVWAVNPPGYGGSDGPASLQKMAAMAHTVLEAVHEQAKGRPVLISGNSLGCISALYLAANFRVDGLFLRNPPPLRELIVGRFGWWNLSLGARLIARQVPRELCAIENAAKTDVPALFILSRKDRVVPPAYQRQIHAAYAGEMRVVQLADADHGCPPSETDLAEYQRGVAWLRQQALGIAPQAQSGASSSKCQLS